MNKSLQWIVRPNTGSDGYIFYNRHQGTFTQNKPSQVSDDDFFSSPSYLSQAPLKVYFDMTYRCNLACRHCITNSSPFVDASPELKTDRIIEIIEELAAIGVLEIAVGGGEPMVHPDWPIIFNHITDLGLNLIITTNGLLINDKNLEILRGVNPLETRISFDGGRTFHNDIRGRDTYDRALLGLKKLIKNDLNTTARFTYCFGVEYELEQMFEDIASTGCQAIKIAILKKAGRAIQMPDLIPRMPDFEMTQWIIDLGQKNGLMIQLSSDDFPINYLEAHDPKLREQNRKNCGAGFETCYISPYGQVLSCVTIPTLEFGRLHNESFTSAWQSQKAQQFRVKANACGSCRICDGISQ
jgi:MoaA/NifB/PqqE/SkfB family radical SAM enzyme